MTVAMTKLEHDTRYWPLIYNDTILFTLKQVSLCVELVGPTSISPVAMSLACVGAGAPAHPGQAALPLRAAAGGVSEGHPGPAVPGSCKRTTGCPQQWREEQGCEEVHRLTVGSWKSCQLVFVCAGMSSIGVCGGRWRPWSVRTAPTQTATVC